MCDPPSMSQPQALHASLPHVVYYGSAAHETFVAEAFREAFEPWSWLPLAGKVPFHRPDTHLAGS